MLKENFALKSEYVGADNFMDEFQPIFKEQKSQISSHVIVKKLEQKRTPTSFMRQGHRTQY